MKKVPLLSHLVNRYPDISKNELYARILCGEVSVAGETIKDTDRLISADAVILFKKKQFVSRGGEKLDYALRKWNIDVSGKIVIDAGCSTGGFTQVLLLHGASHIHAVDVGYNQLDYTLRNRPEISVHERTNIMSMTSFSPPPDAAVLDVSFRSAVPVVRHLFPFLKEKWMLVLIKPQFEWKNPDSNFDGVVRSKDIHMEILEGVIRSFWDGKTFPVSILESPIPGRKGNREFMFEIRESPICTMESLVGTAAGMVGR